MHLIGFLENRSPRKKQDKSLTANSSHHFCLGMTMTVGYRHSSYNDVPEQLISIVVSVRTGRLYVVTMNTALQLS